MRLGHVLCLIATAVLPSTCERKLIDQIQLSCSTSVPTVSVTVRRFSPRSSPTPTLNQVRPNSCCSLRRSNASAGGEDLNLCGAQLQAPTSAGNLEKRQVRSDISESSLEVVTCQGSDVEIVCDISSSPLDRIGWRGPDQVLNEGPALKFDDVQRDDAGTYSCQLEDQRSTRHINLIVEFAPVIFVPEEEIRGAEDRDCVLECVVEALPTAQVTWFKDDIPVGDSSSDGRFQALLEPRPNCTLWASLRVKGVERTNSSEDQEEEEGFGNYTCLAENKHGRTSAYLRFVAGDSVPEPYVERRFNMTGFIIGMCPPMFISFYIILKLGYRSRYAEERAMRH